MHSCHDFVPSAIHKYQIKRPIDDARPCKQVILLRLLNISPQNPPHRLSLCPVCALPLHVPHTDPLCSVCALLPQLPPRRLSLSCACCACSDADTETLFLSSVCAMSAHMPPHGECHDSIVSLSRCFATPRLLTVCCILIYSLFSRRHPTILYLPTCRPSRLQ